MKALLLSLALFAAASPAWAQADASGPERARITAERKQAEARLASEEAACYRIFAVNDCLAKARAKRREQLADLRRQELSLNDAERRRRSAERMRSTEERNAAQKQEDSAAQRAEAVARQQEKKEALDKRALERAKLPSSAPARTAHAKAKHDTAQELQRSQEREADAKERRERVTRRQAETAKSGVKALPVPP